MDESLDVLLGMVGHPYFTEQTIAKEQGIIGQEIKMYDDSPDWRLITGLFECLYHEHPIRSDIAGTVESIAEITPEMLYDSCKAFYAPGNMVLAATGSLINTALLYAGNNLSLFANSIQNLRGDMLAGNNLVMQRDASGTANAEVVKGEIGGRSS